MDVSPSLFFKKLNHLPVRMTPEGTGAVFAVGVRLKHAADIGKLQLQEKGMHARAWHCHINQINPQNTTWLPGFQALHWCVP